MLAHFFSLLLISLNAPLAKAEPVQVSLENVLCSSEETAPVLDASLEMVRFQARRLETLKVFQGWGETRKLQKHGDQDRALVKVQFPARTPINESIGWIPEEWIKSRSACPGAELEQEWFFPQGDGLDDPACCSFPLGKRPIASYHEAPRAFGSARSGRLHAASDLYRQKGDPILAVSEGKVIRSLYFFYQGTYAIEVKHSGGFVVRYGEVLGRQAPNAQLGQSVSQGQTVGYMGKTNCCVPMLHFELYRGTQAGPLTTRTGRYQRRADLLNPTAYLDRWIRSQFRDRM